MKIQQLKMLVAFCLLILISQAALADQELKPEEVEYFENHIRPVLVKNCYECHHSGEDSESEVALDFREGFRKGGENGPLVDFKEPQKSLLLKVIRHEIDGLEMPVGGEKLDEKTISRIEEWLKMGAPDPRDHPPSSEEIEKAASWESIREKRKEWWSFQPVRKPEIPGSPLSDWSEHPIDQFIGAELSGKGLTPASPAERRKLIRRLSFVLTGLPPTQDETIQFLTDTSPDAYEQLVDRYLSSTHFGERWARHWMDWVRFTETHGSEGDPPIPFAYQYRDYLIRALNQDIPYDQLVREHIAGDLIENPRVNQDMGINESALGLGHWRMVFHGFSPTDPLDEKVRFTDDQINVFSKTFLGLTVSCARCHHHKFDAISQHDYYALFGILGSTRPATIDVNIPEKQEKNKQEMKDLKKEIQALLADQWISSVPKFSQSLSSPSESFKKQVEQSEQSHELFYLWNVLSKTGDDKESFQKVWNEKYERFRHFEEKSEEQFSRKFYRRWNMATDDQAQWYRDGNGLEKKSSGAGEFHLDESGNRIVSGIYPAGVISQQISNKHRGVFHSPRIDLDGDYDVWMNCIGGGQSMYRYAVQHYPRSGTIYKVGRLSDETWKWRKFNLDYWKGDQIHLEFSTAQDQAILVIGNDRSWFGVRDVIICKKGTFDSGITEILPLKSIYEMAKQENIGSMEDLARVYEKVLSDLVHKWKDNALNDTEALLLDQYLRAGMLPNDLNQMPDLKEKVARYREWEAEIPVPTRAPGLLEAQTIDQRFMERGNHKKLTEPVPRRFLEAVDPSPYETEQSGRLELAESVLSDENPFTSRVIVNRLWHYLFGNGLFSTTDNLGRLGESPSHPELLDYLAVRMKEEGWSIKSMIRFIVLSKTFQQDSIVSELARKEDPANKYLSHYNMQRLDAEAIRDSILAISGEMDDKQYGKGFNANSLGKQRSVYMEIRRNKLDNFLQAFDAPVPFATKGRRDITNVPAQSLMLLNSNWVITNADHWIRGLFKEYPSLTKTERIQLMYEQAFGVPPTEEELEESIRFLENLESQYSEEAIQYASLKQKLNHWKSEVDNLLLPVREELTGGKALPGDIVFEDLPEPDSLWKFDENLNDLVGNLHGELQGTATIKEGALILDGKGYLKTAPIERDVQEKTLEAWVMLDTYDQSGGGVMTIQTLDGVIFDSIVYAEQEPRRWMPGSNYSLRTLSFNGLQEQEALDKPVHLAIVYEKDGTIRGYRNGKPYGKSVRKSALQSYGENQSQILFGLRHGSPAGNRLLKGRILEARLYFKALSDEEVLASASSDMEYITEKEMVEKLSETDREKLAYFRREIKQVKEEMKPFKSGINEKQAWNDLAHALFNLKKLIYFD